MDNNTDSNFSTTLLTFSWIDYTLFTSMLGISMLIGIYYGCFGSKQVTTKEYLLGGKTMSIFPVAMSLIASNLSGISLLGIPAEIYMYGTQYWTCVLGFTIMGISLIFIYLPVFHKLQVNSGYEYLELKFDRKIRNIATLVFIINSFFYMPVVIYTPALAFNQVSGVDVHVLAPILCIVCIFYTTLGGLKGVVWSDTIQFTITMVAMTVIFYFGFDSVGGIAEVWRKAEESGRIEFFNLDPDPTVRTTFWGILLGNTMMWIAAVGISQSSIQRYMSLSSLTAARKSVVICTLGIIITKCLSCVSGLIMYAKYHDCDPVTSGKVKKMDQILPYYVMDVAGSIPGLSGIFVSGIFTTALSTMSTNLNTLGGTIYEDFIAPNWKPKSSERTATILIRFFIILIGLICIGLVFAVEKLGSVLQISMTLTGLTNGPLLGLFTLGMLVPFANTKGALYGCITSFVFTAWMCIGQQSLAIYGKLPNVFKPLSVEGCGDSLNKTNSTTVFVDFAEEPFWLYRVSFHWYPFVGFMLCVVVSCVISYVTREKGKPIDRKLLSPVVYCMYNGEDGGEREYSSVELRIDSGN